MFIRAERKCKTEKSLVCIEISGKASRSVLQTVLTRPSQRRKGHSSIEQQKILAGPTGMSLGLHRPKQSNSSASLL